MVDALRGHEQERVVDGAPVVPRRNLCRLLGRVDKDGRCVVLCYVGGLINISLKLHGQ